MEFGKNIFIKMPRKKKAATKDSKMEVDPPKAEMKRSSTMSITSNEGEAFLTDRGHVAHNEGKSWMNCPHQKMRWKPGQKSEQEKL